MQNLPKRIALVYDRVNKWGGAEAVLLALHSLFPTAPLFTSVYSSANAPWAKVFPEVIPSFIQQFPLLQTRHELIPWLTPLGFENFDFNQFDAVISVTSADAKGIITPPHTFHLCYCLTPTRYLWSHFHEYSSRTPLVARPLLNYLKRWDKVAASRPDVFVSISNTVSSRVKTFYGRESTVVYPPVDTTDFSMPLSPPDESDYFLYLGRLVAYKRPDLIIKAFNQLNKKLIIIGTGSEEARLQRMAGPNIIFKGFLPQQDKVRYLQHCKSLIFFHEEDFGIVPVEAQACGRPVIALKRGGASESVVHNQTGILVEEDSIDALLAAVTGFSESNFDSNIIRKQAAKFSGECFSDKFAKIFTSAWNNYNHISMS